MLHCERWSNTKVSPLKFWVMLKADTIHSCSHCVINRISFKQNSKNKLYFDGTLESKTKMCKCCFGRWFFGDRNALAGDEERKLLRSNKAGVIVIVPCWNCGDTPTCISPFHATYSLYCFGYNDYFADIWINMSYFNCASLYGVTFEFVSPMCVSDSCALC